MARKLTAKQKKFCDYFIELGNATESAIKAGYSRNSARQIGTENLSKPYIKSYIDKKMKDLEDKQIAKAEEVLIYLTSVLRGEETEEVVVTENIGDFKSKAKVMDIKVSSKERIRAAELIGRRYGSWKDDSDKEKEIAQLEQIKTKTEKLKGVSSDIEDMSSLRKLLLGDD